MFKNGEVLENQMIRKNLCISNHLSGQVIDSESHQKEGDKGVCVEGVCVANEWQSMVSYLGDQRVVVKSCA